MESKRTFMRPVLYPQGAETVGPGPENVEILTQFAAKEQQAFFCLNTARECGMAVK
jgi:hypothetical protein